MSGKVAKVKMGTQATGRFAVGMVPVLAVVCEALLDESGQPSIRLTGPSRKFPAGGD